MEWWALNRSTRIAVADLALAESSRNPAKRLKRYDIRY